MFSTPTTLLFCLLNAGLLLAQLSSLSSTGGQFGSGASEFGSLSQYPSSSSFSGLSTGSIYSPYSSSSIYHGSSYGQGAQTQTISPYSSSSYYPYSQQGNIYGGAPIYGNGLSPFGSSPYSQGSSLGTTVAPFSSSSSTAAYCCVSMSNPVPTTSYGSSGSISPYTSSLPPSSLYNSGGLSPYGSYPPTIPSPYSSGVGSSSYTSIQPYTPVASVICYPLCPNAYGHGMSSYGTEVQSPYSSGFGVGYPYFSGFEAGSPYSSYGFGSGASNYPYSTGIASQHLGATTNISPYSNFNGAGFGGLTGSGFGEGFGTGRFGSSSNFHRRATSTHSSGSSSSPNSEKNTGKTGDKSVTGAGDSLAHVPYASAATKKQ